MQHQKLARSDTKAPIFRHLCSFPAAWEKFTQEGPTRHKLTLICAETIVEMSSPITLMCHSGRAAGVWSYCGD